MACVDVADIRIKEEPVDEGYYHNPIVAQLHNGFSGAAGSTTEGTKRNGESSLSELALKQRKRRKLDNILMNLNGASSHVTTHAVHTGTEGSKPGVQKNHFESSNSMFLENGASSTRGNGQVWVKDKGYDDLSSQNHYDYGLGNYSFESQPKETPGFPENSKGSALLGILSGSLNYRSYETSMGSKVRPSALQKSNKYLSSLLSKPPINTFSGPSALQEKISQPNDLVNSNFRKHENLSSKNENCSKKREPRVPSPLNGPQRKHSQMLHSILTAGTESSPPTNQNRLSRKPSIATPRPRSRTIGSKLEGTIQKLLKEKSSISGPGNLAGDLSTENVLPVLPPTSCATPPNSDPIDGKQWMSSLSSMITHHVMSVADGGPSSHLDGQTTSEKLDKILFPDSKQIKLENGYSDTKPTSLLKTMISKPVLPQESSYSSWTDQQGKESQRPRSNSLLMNLINKPLDTSNSVPGLHGDMYQVNKSANTADSVRQSADVLDMSGGIEIHRIKKTNSSHSDHGHKSDYSKQVTSIEVKRECMSSREPDGQPRDLISEILENENMKVGVPFTYQEDNSGLDRNVIYCFKCQICGKTFRHAGTLKVHERAHTIEKEEFKCEICGKVCTAQGYLNIHMRTHVREPTLGTKNYKCSACGAEFAEAQNLMIHLRMHTGEKLYSCDECGNSFTRKTQLIIHKRIHTGDRPYECEYCHKTFRQSNGLKLHLTTHTDDKPFRCEICGGGFSRKAHYEKHMRKHRGERPFKCAKCYKSFTDKFNLTTHLKIHQETKDHPCSVCNKSFNYARYLKKHMRFHVGEIGFKCQKCGSVFEHKKSLKLHVKEVHPEAEDYLIQLKAGRRRKGENSTNRVDLSEDGETGALELSVDPEKYSDDDDNDAEEDSNDDDLLENASSLLGNSIDEDESCDDGLEDTSSVDDETIQDVLSTEEDLDQTDGNLVS